jgi:Ser/Thr protein kinase RdoA (MazF antagonist)
MTVTLEEIVGTPLLLEELKSKQGRRQTVRAVGPRRRAIVKVYESERAPVVAARLRSLAGGPAEPQVPEVLHVDPTLRLVILSEVPGRPLRAALLAGELGECARAGAALRRWHSFWFGAAPPPLMSHTVERELEILLAWADRAEPAIAETVRRRAVPLSAQWPTPTVVHRDLYEEQIVLGPRIGLIDLDDAALGPAELDVGNLVAHIELLELRKGRDLRAAVEALLGGYGEDALDRVLLDRCRRLTLLRLACIHGRPELVP